MRTEWNIMHESHLKVTNHCTRARSYYSLTSVTMTMVWENPPVRSEDPSAAPPPPSTTHRQLRMESVLVSSGCCNKIALTRWLIQHKLIFNMPANGCLVSPLFLACRSPPSWGVLTWLSSVLEKGERERERSMMSLPLLRTPILSNWSPILGPYLALNSSIIALSSNTVKFTVRASTYEL